MSLITDVVDNRVQLYHIFSRKILINEFVKPFKVLIFRKTCHKSTNTVWSGDNSSTTHMRLYLLKTIQVPTIPIAIKECVFVTQIEELLIGKNTI